MAATADLARKLALDLGIVEAAIDDLPDLAASWDAETLVNQRVYQQEWWDTMARLRMLHSAHSDGSMSSAQAGRLCRIARRLEANLPVIRRIGFSLPPEALTQPH